MLPTPAPPPPAAGPSAPPRLVTPLTAEDYRQLTPEFGVPGAPRYQLVEGKLLPMPAPNRFHQEVSGNLYGVIWTYLRQHPAGVIYSAPFDVYLDDTNVFQPDLVFISAARAAAVLVPEGARGAPDLVVEILSPSTAQLDRRLKLQVYARAGARELWLVDPILRQVQVYDLARDPERPAAFLEETDTLRTPLLPGLDLALTEVFAQRLG